MRNYSIKYNISILIYYIALLLILVSWTDVNNSPNVVHRIAYNIALLLPLYIKHITLLPMIVIGFYTICSNGFAYSYLPTELYIYTFMVLLGVTFNIKKRKPRKIYGYKLYSTLLILIVIVDFLYSFKIENITYCIIICLLFSQCTSYENAKSLKYLSSSFLGIAFVLSFIFILFGRSFIETYNTAEGLDRMGWTDPNYFGCVIGMGTVVALIEMMRKKKSIVYKLFLLTTIMLSLITLGLNASRGAMLAVAVSSMIIILISEVQWFYKILISLLLCGIVAYLYANQYFDLLIYRIEADNGTGSGRSDIWLIKLKTLVNDGNPLKWLFGYSYEGGFNLGYRRPTGFHNDFIAFLVDYGLLGLSLFLAALILPIKRASSKVRPTIIALVTYLALCCMTLEPITAGRLTYFGFYFYILLLSKGYTDNYKYPYRYY